MVLIKASPEGIEQIKQSIKHKSWTVSGDRKNNADALIIVSQQLFREYVKKYLKIDDVDGKSLTSEQLTELVNQEQKIFTPKATNNVNTYITCQLKKRTVNINDFLEEIEIQCLYADRVTSRKWRDFQKGKEIDDDIFEAFCTALEIKNWDNFAIYTHTPNINPTPQTLLVEGLSLFNHQEQVNLLLEKLAYQSRAFLVTNSCHYSRTWMLKRLDAEISATTNLKCNPVNIQGSSYTPLSISQLEQSFLKKYPLKNLKKEHFLIVFDIDKYDSQRLEELLDVFWKPLVSQIPPKLPGQVLMFLLSTDPKNNWTEKLKFNPNLSNQITELPPANPFKAEDLEQLIPKIYIKLRKKLPSDKTPLQIADSLINKSQGKSEKLLQEIYDQFKCKQTEFSVWQRYP